MDAYKIETTLTENGTLTLTELPFHAGDHLEIILLAQEHPKPGNYSLRGTPIKYDLPTEPVAADDWEATR